MRKTIKTLISAVLALCMVIATSAAVSAKTLSDSSALPQIYAEFKLVNTWVDGAANADSKPIKSTQFNVVIHNNSDFDIKSWQIDFDLQNGSYWVPEFWGFEQNHANDVFSMTSLSWNGYIAAATESNAAIGFTVKGYEYLDSFYATVKVIDSTGTTEQVDKATGDNDIPEQPTEPTTTPDDKPVEKTVAVKVVTPKRMSIRLEDGRVLKTGDSFDLAIGSEIKFQMCSNNWDNDIYDDNGNGLCGTVVYTFKVANSHTERGYDEASHTFTAPKGDPALRTDVNKCFMAYRFGNTGGNYNKQTGIKQVVNTPLESLSVNLPLGSTVTADGYKAMQYVISANIFVETSQDKTISYTDYKWSF